MRYGARILSAVYSITFPLEGHLDHALARVELVILLSALASIDRDYIEAFPRIPPLANAPLEYSEARSRLVPPNQFTWQDIASSLPHREPDGRVVGGRVTAPDVVAWRVAELNIKGIAAVPGILIQGNEWRPVVHLPGGQTEDLAPKARYPLLERVRITIALDLFNGQNQKALSNKGLNTLLRALTLIDVAYLKSHPGTPKLHDSDIFYREEPPGAEDWQDIPTCLREKACDCDDLGCWRAAELIVEGIDAWAIAKEHPRPDGGILYHIVTQLPDGRIEDPSRDRGMR